jgi:3'-phosphoadenosine 5'-phosphosulfate sulfotransferase (PAPS reductase)/FAD synthetase
MRDPFRIKGPACISFSGGRTSGYMLWRILQAHGGTLPEDVVVCFSNTGKERAETLDFVEECSQRWSVPIVWLEYRDDEARFAQVTHPTASREGEPFEAIIRKRKYLPNPLVRFCTVELKVRTCHRYLKSLGWTEWDSHIGIRADEQRRLAKIANQDYGTHETKRAPLAIAGVTKRDVQAFWEAQPFDLRLENVNGETPWGNCDLCFLKSNSRIASLIATEPQRATWWARMETIATASKPSGFYFRTDRPSYAAMQKFSTEQRDMFVSDDNDLQDCACTD